MSEQGNGQGTNGAGTNGAPEDQAQGASLQMVSQYVKDMSFENPSAPVFPTQRPAIDFGIDIGARRLDPEHFEVELKIRAQALGDDKKTLFLLELAYGGVFRAVGMSDDMLQPVLLVECPFILFPFARRVVADMVRDGGMPPLVIEPIDFGALYRARAAEAMAQRPDAQLS